MKILFISDNHYQSFGGRTLASALNKQFDLTHLEDQYGEFLATSDLEHFDLLMTCAIGDSPGSPHAPPEAEERVKAWLAKPRPVVLIHGGSATFWKWDWWRELVGLRWVRGKDPDGVEPSTHPVVPFALERVKSKHPLASRLHPFDAPTDELYIELEETRPIQRLLEASHEGRSHIMAYSSVNQWGGTVLGYLPGHRADVVNHPLNIANVAHLLNFAVAPNSR